MTKSKFKKQIQKLKLKKPLFKCVQNGHFGKQLSKVNTRMSANKLLREFLDNPARQASATGNWTHTSLAGGKWFINEDDIGKFYELYTESILDGDKQHLVERSTDIGPLRIDFDFIYDESTNVKKHLHTRDQVIAFASAYMTEIKQYLNIPEPTDVYIMEKRKPTYDRKKQRIKSGIHIVVPSVCTHKYIEQRVRRTLLPRMEEFFAGLPLKEEWDKVYDEGVVNRSVPWTLYGSRKNDVESLPYLTSYILRYTGDEMTVIENAPEISVDVVKTLSLRRDLKDETPMTDAARELYDTVRKKDTETKNIGGEQKRRGRPPQRSEKPSSRASSPAGRILQPLTPEKKDYLKAHTMNLDECRFKDYDKWVQVGICLYNIHPDLLDVFLDFSAQSQEKYNEADCINKWNSLTYRNDGDRLGEPTLRFWSREDNRDGYDEIERSNVDRLIMLACSGTEFDVASVIYAKFRDHYKCADFRNNVWYRWMGHVWQETDQGVDLQLKLSKQIASVFFDRMTIIGNEMSQRGLTNCSGDGKEDCGACEYCQMESQRMGLNKIYTKLKTTSFKGNIMRECRELFYDVMFNKLVDSNKELIAFNNGVLELDTFVFRPGKPEDYMSFSTGIDYEVQKPYYEYSAWPQVEKFIRQVIPDREVRDYFMQHLATNLFGGNTAQKFHILTGSGSNGKSMIMNLMSKALGDYASTVPISLFTQKRKSSGSAAPEVARLKGRRFVTMQEPDEAIALNTGLMKEISSGEKMYARDLFKSGGEFEVLAKFHLACNEKPKINTTDGGTWRRLVVINFTSKFVVVPSSPNEFPMDESIQFSVNSTEWATPFLSYLIHTLKEGKGLRKLTAPGKVLEYTNEYRSDNDAIAKFIMEKLAPIQEGDEIQPIDKEMIRKIFKQWRDDNDQKALTPAEMEKRVEAQFGKFHRPGWTNFKINM
jgi:P4 family phage/plasmid primase-like protien